MYIEINSTLEYIEEHGLQNRYYVVDNYKWYWIITEEVNGECWFNVFYNPNLEYIDAEYCFSSIILEECLDYCNIPYYRATII